MTTLYQLNFENGHEQYRLEADAIARQSEIGGTVDQVEISDPVDELEYSYDWVELENSLRRTDLFGIAFQLPAPLILITHAFANTEQTDENRWSDFEFAVTGIQTAYSTEQKNHFNILLSENGFPLITFG